MMTTTAPLMLCDRTRCTTPNIHSLMLPSGGLAIDFQVYKQDKQNATALVSKGIATINALIVERDEANNQVLELDERLAQMTKERDEALAQLAKKTKTKAPKKPKAVPKYVSNAGANAKAQRRLQGAGKLEPFREGGCRCRVWGNGLGNQCHAKGKTEDGFCLAHSKKIAVAPDNQWCMGFYDTARPEKWGECGVCPNDRKAGNTIPWKMDEETFTKAFSELNLLDKKGQVQLDLEDAEGSEGSDQEVEVEVAPAVPAVEVAPAGELIEGQPIAGCQEVNFPIPGGDVNGLLGQEDLEQPFEDEDDDASSTATLELSDGENSENSGDSNEDFGDLGY